MRLALRAGLGALLALAAVSPAVASAQSPALLRPRDLLRRPGEELPRGQALQVDVRNAGGRKVTQVCMTPAPIARAACSAATTIAPSAAGPTTVQATLADGTKFSQTFTVLAPATKVGGSRAVPATITCQDVTLFGNYDRRTALARSVRGREEGHPGRPLQLHRPREDLHVGLRDEQGRVRDAVLRAGRLAGERPSCLPAVLPMTAGTWPSAFFAPP